ncbi:MAG: monovalent cation/H(+) antiporter subunit G [Planctomycetota bacterium]
MSAPAVVSGVLLGLGCFVALTSALGVLRFPDFFTRMHPAGKSDTLGQTLILAGLAVAAGASLVSLKLGLIWLFLTLSTPCSTHAIARAAWIDGKLPWSKGGGEAAS